MSQAYIVATARTAGGRRNGRLKDWHPADLGGLILDAILDRSGIDPQLVEDVVFGCVQQVGQQSQNVARTAVLSSRLPEHVPGVTIDRQCGSSQQAIHFAAQAVLSGTMDIIIAGGVENMSRVPMLLASTLPEANGMGHYRGQRFEARYGTGEPNQFDGAEMMAEKYQLTKDDLDAYALESHRKAAAAAQRGDFRPEIVSVPVLGPGGEQLIHDQDEGIRFDASIEGIRKVKTLREGGKVSAANASQICDAASAVLIVNEQGLKRLGIDPIARIHHMAVRGSDPLIMLDAPIPATQQALARSGMTLNDIDLVEINEAFASVPLSWMKALGADPDKVNVNGGAIALGHALGSSGTRLMTTLLNTLQMQNKRYGLQTMCEGGGLANVTIVERL